MISVVFHHYLYGQDPLRYSLVIHEIYADPSPSRGLPNIEFIEIRNRSGKDVNLRNWMVSNGTTTGKITANYILKHDSLAILVSSSSVNSFSMYGTALALSPFPGLNNEGDTLTLLSPAGSTIHALAWEKSWYGNDAKEDGGWSLELRDAGNPCAGKENWGASVAINGGTPGKRNSIADTIADNSYARVLYAYMPDSITLFALFNEPVNYLSSVADIQIENGPSALTTEILAPLFNVLKITLSQSITQKQVYRLFIGSVSDCSGNKSPPQVINVGVSSIPLPGDIIVNELLFNPPQSGADYLELFNASKKIIDVKSLLIANRNSLGKISSITEIVQHSRPFFPGDYLVLTVDTGWIMKTYQPGEIDMVTTDLPSYPDTEGNVVLLDNMGNVLEEFVYSDSWHFQLITNVEGVALERIMQNQLAQNRENWHSASSSSGYGTPGKINSQQVGQRSYTDPWSYSTRLISPDGDGRDDLLIISYSFLQPGCIANLTIFNASGKPVKRIAQNALCGTSGFFRWDGTGQTGEKLARGHYILSVELFRLDGKVIRSREVIGIW